MFKILVDADACPVKDIIVSIAEKYNIKVIMFSNFSHEISTNSNNVEVVRVDNGADIADFKIANATNKFDIVVTQDYGLATMVLAKSAYSISPNGLVYDNNNIDSLLFNRHANKVNRRQKKYTSIPKRKPIDNSNFLENFELLCLKAQNNFKK